MSRAAGRRARLAGSLGSMVVVASTVAACSSVPSSTPTGVDGLVVPTPSPAPSDFVEQIDNSWLGWSPGATTTYREEGEGGDPDQVVVEVAKTTTEVAGLAATTVITSTPDGVTTDWYAQDRAGNVWWLGREGEWQAGRSGARAGLWMPAEPRTGDGFVQGAADGVVADVATVLTAPEPDTTAASSSAGAMPEETRLEVTSELTPAATDTRTYVRGRGLSTEVRTGPDGFVRLRETS